MPYHTETGKEETQEISEKTTMKLSLVSVVGPNISSDSVRLSEKDVRNVMA